MPDSSPAGGRKAPALLEATHLSHAFEYPLFEDIDLSLHENESVAIVGVSGSGK